MQERNTIGASPQDVALFRAGDREAAARLTERALRSSLRTAAAVLGNRDQAADVAQDVAVEVLRGIRRLRDVERFDAWVHRITVRQTMRALRKRRSVHTVEAEYSGAEDIADAKSLGADNAPQQLALTAAMASALAELPARQRLALALRYVHDLTDDEIAAALKCRPGTVHALLSRGRAGLRSQPALADFAPAPNVGDFK